MRQLPIKTKIAAVDVTHVFGQPLFNLFRQVVRILDRSTEGEQLKNLFAEPSISKIEHVIYWRTWVTGNVRLWSDLTDPERFSATKKITLYCESIQKLCDVLTKEQGPNALIVEALRCMLVSPGIEESLCLVGDQLVLTQWGCRPFGRQASDYDLKVQGAKARAYLKIAATDLPVDVASPDVKSGDSGEQDNLPSEIPESNSRPAVPEKAPAETNNKVDDAHVQAPEEPAEVVVRVGPSLNRFYWRWLLLLLLLIILLLGLLFKKWTYLASYDVAAEARYRAEIADLWLKIDDKSKTCRPIPPSKTAPQPLTPEALERKDLNVFNGNWLLITTLLNAKTDEKIQIQFSFDSRGNGITTTRELSGNVCTGTAVVTINSANGFSVETSQQSCVNGGAYRPNKAECTVRNDNKTADCILRCVHGNCDARFERR
jgi:hypothetical protein